jgi:copper chaperone CopZ
MKSVTVTIEGMHCTGCAQTIEMLLGAERGVKEAQVSFESKSARIVYDGAVANEERLAAVIERAGFRVPRPA